MAVHVCCIGPCIDVVKRLSKDPNVALKRFENVSQLLLNLFKRRLCDPDVTFEGPCVLLCYEPVKTKLRSTSPLNSLGPKALSYCIRDMFPCFNLITIPVNEFMDYYDTVVIPKLVPGMDDTDDNLDRLSNIYRWMYSDSDLILDKEEVKGGDPASGSGSDNGPTSKSYVPCCSDNLYTMASHLAYLSPDVKNSHEMIPVWDYLDFTDLVQAQLKNDNDFYWKSLDSWNFCAHSLSCTELVWCSYLILNKLSKQCNLSHTPPGKNRLLLMLLNIEATYHQTNKFHNFKHAVDVLQATYRLCHLLELPSLPSFLLCIAAIGHDVGHPGTNNMLFNRYHSPLSQYYKEQSVLENFHADVYLDILSRYWPGLSHEFTTIKDSIIATDMALHNHYVETIKQETVPTLAGLTSLIIKAADISNVTRPLLISAKWAALITMEFTECALLEKNLIEWQKNGSNSSMKISHKLPVEFIGTVELPSTIDELLKRYPSIPKGQTFFIDTFALSLFSGLGLKFKQLYFLVDNVESNRKFWIEKGLEQG